MTQSQTMSASDLRGFALREGWDFDLSERPHLRRGAASHLDFATACELFSTLSGPHDFWWPLVKGPRPIRNALVIEDTWGALATRLTEFAAEVCAIFTSEPDAALLRATRVSRNVSVSVSPTLQAAPEWNRKWDLIVLQRPAGSELQQLRTRAFQCTTVGGSVIIIDELRASRSTAVFDGRGKRIHWSDLKSLSHNLQTFVADIPVRALLTVLPELYSRHSDSCIDAIREGRREHGLRRRALLDFLLPTSMLAAEARSETYVERMLNNAKLRRHLPADTKLRLKRIFAGNEDTTVLLAGTRQSCNCEVVLRTAHRPRARDRVRRNAMVLETLANEELQFQVPRLLDLVDEPGGVLISAESCVPGTALLSVGKGAQKQSCMRSAIQQIETLRSRSAQAVNFLAADYERLFGSAFEKIRDFSAASDAENIERLDHYLRSALCGRVWSLGPTHGDFKVGNILVGESGDVSGVIDWDCWESHGLPLMDVMTLCVYEDARELSRHLGESITLGLFDNEWSDFHHSLLEQERRRHELSKEEFDVLKVAFWVLNLRDRIHWLVLSHEHQARDYLSKPLERAIRLLGTV